MNSSNIKYNLEWLGGMFVEVNPRYTSQQCYICRYIKSGNRQTQREFRCLGCGHIDHADTNAAKNILAAGHAVLACGAVALATSMNQVPLEMGINTSLV